MQVIQIQMLNLISDAKLQKRERSVTWVKYFDSRTSVKHVNCQYMGNKNKRKKHNADQLIYCSPSQLVLTLLATYGHASIRPLKIRMWLLAACLTLMNRSVLWLFVSSWDFWTNWSTFLYWLCHTCCTWSYHDKTGLLSFLYRSLRSFVQFSWCTAA